jgi:hypothetical protein
MCWRVALEAPRREVRGLPRHFKRTLAVLAEIGMAAGAWPKKTPTGNRLAFR